MQQGISANFLDFTVTGSHCYGNISAGSLEVLSSNASVDNKKKQNSKEYQIQETDKNIMPGKNERMQQTRPSLLESFMPLLALLQRHEIMIRLLLQVMQRQLSVH